MVHTTSIANTSKKNVCVPKFGVGTFLTNGGPTVELFGTHSSASPMP